jgi:hypothetical protein
MENRKFDNLKDTLIGNWWSIDDGESLDYNESLFINDSIYHFTYYLGHISPMNYWMNDRQLVINQFNSDTIYLSIDVMDKNTIHFLGYDTTVLKNLEIRIDTFDYTINRIPDSEFTLSDIKCWAERENMKGVTIYNKQTKKFRKEFYKRAYKKFK